MLIRVIDIEVKSYCTKNYCGWGQSWNFDLNLKSIDFQMISEIHLVFEGLIMKIRVAMMCSICCCRTRCSQNRFDCSLQRKNQEWECLFDRV